MTTPVSSIENDPKYIKCLDKGFVGLIDHLGSDQRIISAARVSYGSGTKSVREDRGLLRYLMKHRHTSPFEQCVVTLHIKLPIFVMRQLVRHRTASLNEYSARYSVMSDEFYIPEPEVIQPQSSTNKQGRSGTISDKTKEWVQREMESAFRNSYNSYTRLLTPWDETEDDDEFPGIARETARAVLPVANYTECYWTQNLHNLFHLLKLRMDGHAQYEIQVFAKAIFDLVQPLYPDSCKAWEDYVYWSTTLSRMEKELLFDVIKTSNIKRISFNESLNEVVNSLPQDEFLLKYDLTKREWNSFKEMFENI